MATKPSSSAEGFFQEPPVLENPFHDDEALQRALRLFVAPSMMTSISQSLTSLGSLALAPTTLSALSNAELQQPHLVPFSSFGVRQDHLITSPGWQILQSLGISNGMVSTAYPNTNTSDNPFLRIHQFSKIHLWTPSAALVTCPSAMTDGAAKVLSRHASNPIFSSAYSRLISSDPAYAWTSGQWMTERKGGSDVSGTETLATHDPDSPHASFGPWSISGFKWFSSATDADCAILLAQTGKGLSCFFAEMRLPGNEDALKAHRKLNGVRIQRLKSKLGTKALPTAELELVGMRAWLVGKEGDGIREISRVLNVTRLHTAVGAVGYWGRGLQVARAYAKVRKVKGGKVRLIDVPAHVATLASVLVEYRANVMLTVLVEALLGREEFDERSQQSVEAASVRSDTEPAKWSTKTFLPQNAKQVSILLRVLTPIVKGLASKAAITGLQECMEALGGVGYLENEDPALNIARMFRDANVLSIWEGTTDVLADDLIRVIKGRDAEAALDALEKLLDGLLDGVGFELDRLATEVSVRFQDWRKKIVGTEAEELRATGRETMRALGWLVCAALLLADAGEDNTGSERDGDAHAIALEVAKRWFAKVGKEDFGASRDWREEFRVNRRLVQGSTPESNVQIPKSRL